MHWQDHCNKCNGKRIAESDGKRFYVFIPSSCKHKDACEEVILRKAGVIPVRTPDGEIVR